ncbi:MAG: hypothetical protein GY832_04745 [Chloroflexi bacterium]|nr:hypothetical protein [Chloroflexota bacterium]
MIYRLIESSLDQSERMALFWQKFRPFRDGGGGAQFIVRLRIAEMETSRAGMEIVDIYYRLVGSLLAAAAATAAAADAAGGCPPNSAHFQLFIKSSSMDTLEQCTVVVVVITTTSTNIIRGIEK